MNQQEEIEQLKRVLQEQSAVVEKQREQLKKLLDDQSKSQPVRTSPEEKTSQEPTTPSTTNPSTIQLPIVQTIAEVEAFQQYEDIADYLANFDALYDTYPGIQDSFRLQKLIAKVPKYMSYQIKRWNKNRQSYEQIKKLLIEQFGMSLQARQQKFDELQYHEGEDLVQFVYTGQELLGSTELSENVVTYEIYKKLPPLIQKYIKTKDIPTIECLANKCRSLKEFDIFEILKLRDLSVNKVIPRATQPVSAYMNEGYPQRNNRGGRGRGRGRFNQHNPPQVYTKSETNPLFEESAKTPTPVPSHETQNTPNDEVTKAVRFSEDTKQVNFVGILKNPNSTICQKDTEAFMETRSGTRYEGTSRQHQCKQEENNDDEEHQNMNPEFSEFNKKKRRNSPQYERTNQQQNTQFGTQRQDNQYVQPNQTYSNSGTAPIVFGEQEVCDSSGKVNLTGLLRKIEIKLPLHTYLNLNNQEITIKDPNARPVNIYQNDKHTVKFIQQEQSSCIDKIVLPVVINNVVFQAILDTGAEYTIISTEAVKKANLFHRINKKTSDKVRGVSGI